jgi:diguanylate cyclase (GGDEF)-like protein
MAGGQHIATGKSGLGRRIAHLVAIAAFLAVALAATVQTALQTSREIESRRSLIEGAALAISATAGEAVAERDQAKALSSLKAIARIPDLKMASIVLSDGTALASMGHVVVLSDDILTTSQSNASMLCEGVMPIAVNIIKGGKVQAKLYVLADISGLREQVFSAVLLTFAAALIAALLGMFASRPLQRRIVMPLVKLTQAIKQIRQSRDYSSPLQDDNAGDETSVLVKSFNGLMADIRERDGALQRLAYHDPLTGLANRVSFQRTLEAWLSEPFKLSMGSVVLLNIHGFRSLNDAFSHSIGDAILMTVAAQINASIRDGASLARYSADEFVILLREHDTQAEVELAIARIQAAFFKPVQIGELELHVSLTAGAVLLGSPECSGVEADVILRYVDLALVEARRLVTGRVHFFEQKLSDTLQQETELGQALRLAAKEGAFHLNFQAQLDLLSNEVCGFEALVRWTDPERGPISPAVFIPLAERNGLVSVIGDWVLQESCNQAAEWLRQGHPRRMISVNISPAQLLAAGFVEKVTAALRKSGLPPELLCLELTESIFVGANYAETIILLETLATKGIRLSLDDFGTGYSSLSYLSKLPFHTIKIDRAFVSKADKSERKLGMLSSIVEMVHALGMDVVAEGAERPEEVALLRTLSVDKVQGYAVAKPLANAEALKVADTFGKPELLATA